MLLNWNLVLAVVVRHLYHFRHSLDRFSDAFYWPAMDIFIWGFTFSYVAKTGTNFPELVSVMLTAVILFIVVWRSQYEITVNLLEEMWNQNIVNLFSSPLRVREWIVAVFILGFMKLFLSVTFAALLAYILYGVNIFRLGYQFMPFVFSLLIIGWAYGLVIASFIVYYGMRIQAIAWMGVYLFVPISGVYYAVATLPDWAQKVSVIMPMRYVFEGMRSVLLTGTLDWSGLIKSLILGVISLIIGIALFLFMFNKSKERGLQKLE